MKFEIVKGSKIGNTEEQYFTNEKSFDWVVIKERQTLSSPRS